SVSSCSAKSPIPRRVEHSFPLDHNWQPPQRLHPTAPTARACPVPTRNMTMKSFVQWTVELLRREDGPTAVEYAVMLALIVVVCIAAITALGTNANQTFTTVSGVVAGTGS